jgi:uncharacterized membrane protein
MFLLLLLLFPVSRVNCQNYTGYKITINPDNSASWTITKLSDPNAAIDTWEGFQNRVFNIAEVASAATGREMAIDESTLQINTTIVSGSKITEYIFVWLNFSQRNNREFVFGDVFEVKDFFTQLYGEASIEISYPSNFAVKSANPMPDGSHDSDNPLKWYSTQTLVNNKVNVVLNELDVSSVSQNAGSLQQYAFVSASLAIAASATLAGLYIYRRRKNSSKGPKAQVSVSSVKFEEDDDKVLGLLKASGGTMRQSTIVEMSKFSKAKTSQLLAALETRGLVTRYMKGRDKIVVLNEPGKGEKT